MEFENRLNINLAFKSCHIAIVLFINPYNFILHYQRRTYIAPTPMFGLLFPYGPPKCCPYDAPPCTSFLPLVLDHSRCCPWTNTLVPDRSRPPIADTAPVIPAGNVCGMYGGGAGLEGSCWPQTGATAIIAMQIDSWQPMISSRMVLVLGVRDILIKVFFNSLRVARRMYVL